MIKTLHYVGDTPFEDLETARAFEAVQRKKEPIDKFLQVHRSLDLDCKKATEYRNLLIDFLLVWPELDRCHDNVESIGSAA